MPLLSFRAENGVGAIATSPSGRDVALASRSGLYIVDLQEPYTPPRLLSLRTPWEVSSVQWCSHPNHYNRVVSTASQKLVVWNLMLPSHNAVEHVLHGHNRAITDVSFSRLSPDLLATCSIDTYVHIWDMRDPLRPSMSFADFEAGASQVKWSKTQPHLLASAHQNRLLLWDSRKQNVPLIEIAAHSRRINSIDFDDTSNNNLATASIDRSIKVWNLNDLKRGGEQTARLVVRARFPVWRTRYLPDGGNGAFVVPLRGSNNNAYLADLSPCSEEIPFEPVQTFSAHKAPIKDISLRREGHGYNLLTWGGDDTLNMWGVDESSLNAVNVPTTTMPILPRDYTYRLNPETGATQTHLPVRSGFFRMANENDDHLETADDRHINWIAGVRVNGSSSHTRAAPQFAQGAGGDNLSLTNPKASNLSAEITAASAKFPKVHFELIDIANGKCVFTARGPWGREDDEVVTLRVHARFPHEYPQAPLECNVEEDPNSDPTKIAEMEQYLSESAATIAQHGKPALEFCLRYLMGDSMPIETIIFEPLDPMDPTCPIDSLEPLEDFDDAYNSTDSEYGIGHVDDTPNHEVEDVDDIERNPDNIFIEGIFKPKIDSTPLPRTCSAIWSSTGHLVVFVNTQKEKNVATDLYALGRVLPGEEESESESSISSFESEGEEQSKYKSRQFPRGFQVRPWTIKTAKSVASTEDTVSAVASEVVQILDFNNLLPCRRDIAAEYRYDFKLDNVQELIDHNAQVAERHGKHEDAYIWKLSRYHSSKNFAQTCQTELVKVGGNEFLLPFFNFYASKFHSSLIEALIEYLKSTGNYMLLVGIDCINCVRYGDQMEQLTRTFYYNGGRPSSFVTYFESHHTFAHPRALSASPAPDVRPKNKRHADRNKMEVQNYLPLAVTHTTAEVIDSKLSSGLAAPPYRRSHHSSASMRKLSKTTSDLSSSATEDGTGPVLKIKIQYLNPILSNADFDVESGNGYPQLMSRYSSSVEEMLERRKLYTGMLDAWGLSIKRLEILNIPLPVSEFETAMDNEIDDEWMIGIKLAQEGHNSRSTCVYCLQLLTTQLVTCLRCNHLYHRKCLQTWSQVSSECATGCGCVCMPLKP